MPLTLLLMVGLLFSGQILAQQDNQQEANNASADAKQVEQQYAENYVFADPAKRKVFLNLTAELRCPKCQNQNIADSDAPIAHDMRRKVYELMQEGKDKPEVIGWMKERYGDFVYYQPPLNPVTFWLWALPILFALIMLVVLVRRRKVIDDADVEQKLARAEQLLKEE
ncbi:cytochrome c-type biogenesis protein [Glaciecola petra]|uniref:Cytochrome c-type biogenesis protein n=1 Tax=Glaciecola petra TaxID=3075602 RepID=A0ABU2ZQB3_9ALTE|nr:cytochrome c-type biogenesis protein [Aestuariibacter sp. P117]MDT0593647.1 cytochrome c-type biogenesis protein [Aestuariibacter sp. P117]